MQKEHEELKDWRRVERDFFNSLSHLAELYGFVPLDVSHRPYPHNILLSYRYAVEQVRELSPELKLVVIQDETHAACLATVAQFDTKMTLYFIPVRPLYELLLRNRCAGEMLLSVYSYLYQVAAMPYYRDSSAYMHYNYEMLSEWILDNPDDWDRDELIGYVNNLNSLSYYGDIIGRKIRNPYNLHSFSERVGQFVPQSANEEQLHEVCKKYLQLYMDFPHRSIMENIHEGMLASEMHERVQPDQYISFYWDYDDRLCSSLIETINSDLQERDSMDEPMTVQLFDMGKEQLSPPKLEFEQRFFDLIGELNSIV